MSLDKESIMTPSAKTPILANDRPLFPLSPAAIRLLRAVDLGDVPPKGTSCDKMS